MNGPRKKELGVNNAKFLILKQSLRTPEMASIGFRSSKRLTITVPQSTIEALAEHSSREGRSLSNLAAYLLESSLERRGSSAQNASQRPRIH